MYNTLELPRKIGHMISGIIYLIIAQWLGYGQKFVVISMVLFIGSLICMRLVARFPWWRKLFQKIMRKENPIKGVGVPMYLGGIFLACTVQYLLDIKFEILVYAIVTLAIGDGIATIVGKSSLGSFRPKGYEKSYSGGIIGILFSIGVSYFILKYYGYPINIKEIILYTSIGMTIEFLLVGKKCHQWCLDNFLIPIGIIVSSIIISYLY